MAKKHNNKKSKVSETPKKDDIEENKYNRTLILLLILLIGIIPGLFDFSSSPNYNYDLNVLYTRVSSIMRFIANFEYPTINPDLHFGEFNVYYPFAFILTSLLAIIVKNVFLGAALARIVISLLSTLIFYKICRYEKIDIKVSILLTFLFSFMIYHLALLKGSLSWAGTFIFAPPMVYFLYRSLNEHNPKFEIYLIISSVFLILTSFAPFLYVIYFFLAYIAYQILKKNLRCDKEIILKFFIALLFVIGISSFYTFTLLSVDDSLAWSKILTQTTFSPSRESFIKSGIDPLSLVFVTKNFTTFGIIPVALFLLSLYTKRNSLSSFDRYLIIMTALSLTASIFPLAVAYLPFVGNTEYGSRALVIGAFSLLLLSKHALYSLKEKIYFPLLALVIISAALGQVFLTGTGVLYNEDYPYANDIEDFHSSINATYVTRVNYRFDISYPLCENCIGFGAPENYYGNVRDGATTNLWGYIDFAQRNPADTKTSGLLGEKYAIVSNELVSGYIDKGYRLSKSGEKASLLENPNSTSILQFISEQNSMDLKVERKGGWFSAKFKTESDGILLIKFAYHPLAEVFDNNEKLEVRETNYGIMYVELKKGSHEIRFHYGTYLYYYISIFSIIAFIYYYKNNRIF